MLERRCWLCRDVCSHLLADLLNSQMPVASQQDPYKCQEIVCLKRQPRAAEAQQLLERVASQVQPIMRNRCWTVRKLSEFFPGNPGLLGLNVNRGAEVKIRLRPARDAGSFYDWNHVLGTMLHELCHIEVGPHNAAFYKLLDELWCEAEALMDKGITGSGQGFDAPSAGRLGSHSFIPTHNPPEHRMAVGIRKAAEARAATQGIMPAGPRKLGSNSGSRGGLLDYKSLTPAQAAAMAAERRAQDNLWCGAEHTPTDLAREQQQPGDDDDGGACGPAPGSGTEQLAAAAGVVLSRTSAPAAAAAAAAVAAGQAQSAATLTAQQRQQEQQQQQQQQQQLSRDDSQQPNMPPEGSSAQAELLRQQWQQHLCKQQELRQQQQQQRASSKKRPAADTIDLTFSDDEGDGGDGHGQQLHPAAAAATGGGSDAGGGGFGGAGAAAAAAAAAVHVTCPCCDAAAEGFVDAAVLQRLSARQGFQQWCALHERLRQEATAAAAGSAGASSWTCKVCTLINSAADATCQACLSGK